MAFFAFHFFPLLNKKKALFRFIKCLGYSKSKRIEESVKEGDVHKMNRKHRSER